MRATYERLGEEWTRASGDASRVGGIALQSILHELLLTEFELAVSKTVSGRGDLARLLAERRYFAREKQLRFRHGGRTQAVIPDAGFLVRYRQASQAPGAPEASGASPSPASLLLHFVELDNGTMPVGRIGEKLRLYDDWSRSAEAREYLQRLNNLHSGASRALNFRLLVIVRSQRAAGDARRQADILGQTATLSAAMRDRVWLTTAEALQAHQRESSPLSPALWIRGRDGRGWLTACRDRVDRLPDAAATARRKELREFVVRQSAAMPRHALFPAAQVALRI